MSKSIDIQKFFCIFIWALVYVLCTLEDVIRESARVLKPKKSLFMVHRPFRLAEIFKLMMKHRLEPKRMRFVHPYIDKEPNIVLIESVLDGNPMN